MKSISLDRDMPFILLVGAYREDEVPEYVICFPMYNGTYSISSHFCFATSTHPLALRIREKEQMGIVITAIKVGNLSSHNVTSLVAEALGMEDDEKHVQTLAATVHKKTEGNAFFMLVSKGDFMC